MPARRTAPATRARRVGSLADAGCFSFYPTKNLGGWGDGGALVTNNAELAAKVTLLRSHGESPRHNHQLVTGTHRLDALQAAILDVKLRHLDDWNASRAACCRDTGRGAGRYQRRAAPGRGRRTATTSTTSSSSARRSAMPCATTSTRRAWPARSTTPPRSTCSPPTLSSGSAPARCPSPSDWRANPARCRSSRRSRTGTSTETVAAVQSFGATGNS